MAPEEFREETGRISIAKDAVATIAALALAEVPGVLSPSGETLSRETTALRCVETQLLEGRVRLTLRIAVEFGQAIPEVAQKLQEKVKTEVERMTALPVEAVDVEVLRVVVPKERS